MKTTTVKFLGKFYSTVEVKGIKFLERNGKVAPYHLKDGKVQIIPFSELCQMAEVIETHKNGSPKFWAIKDEKNELVFNLSRCNSDSMVLIKK